MEKDLVTNSNNSISDIGDAPLESGNSIEQVKRNKKDEATISTHPNGVECRWENRRVVVLKNKNKEGTAIIEFHKFDKESKEPTIFYKYRLGKHASGVCVSSEALESLFHAIYHYMKSGFNIEQNPERSVATGDDSSTNAGNKAPKSTTNK